MSALADTDPASGAARGPGAGSRRRRFGPLALALLLLALLWGGPLPGRAEGSFAAHMVLHMGVVALAAPLLAFAVLRAWPRRARHVSGRLALLAAVAEFVLVWSWHAPALHDAARARLPLLVLEQGSFLFAGLFVWLTAFAGEGGARDAGDAVPCTPARGLRPLDPLTLVSCLPEGRWPSGRQDKKKRGSGTASPGRGPGRRPRHAVGVAGLLVTSMHMTLLGALLLLAPRPLYACGDLCSPFARLTPLEDQQLGGVLMLIVGGSAYLAGGLGLLASVLREPQDPAEAAR